MTTPWMRITITLAIVAALCVGMDQRMERAGQWLPPLSQQVAGGTGKDLSLPAATLAYMDHPKYVLRAYALPSGETVYANVIAVNGIESFHDPTVCAAGSGFQQVDQQSVPLSGPGTDARALGFQNGATRVVMVYWRQGRNGSVVSDPLPGWSDLLHSNLSQAGSVHPNYNLLLGRSTCIARIYAAVPVSDTTGAQTCDHVLAVSRMVYADLQRGS